MKGAFRLGLAGFAATAVAYGPARTGFGLFVPDFRGEFGISTGVAGVMGSGLQGGFLLALVATVLLVGRLGPRLLIAAGGVSAIVGMLLVALAPNGATLAAGVCVAGMSAGFCWSPYNDLAGSTVRAGLRSRVLSVVSTGTTLGIAVSGLVAIAAVVGELPWRAVWLALVAAGFVGLLTGDLVDRIGLNGTLRLTILCLGAGAMLLGVAPGSITLVGVAAVLYGAGVMFMSAL